jgi:hypothetical protein
MGSLYRHRARETKAGRISIDPMSNVTNRHQLLRWLADDGLLKAENSFGCSI